MKKIILFFLVSGYALSGLGQDQISSGYQPKNVVKFLPVTLPFNSVSFEFERMINSKNSVTIQVGLPDRKSIIGKYGINSNSDLKTADFGSTVVRGAYRHYTGKSGLPKGFYLEPYLKYQQLKGRATIAGIDDQGDAYSGKSEIKFSTINTGCQLGYQFLIVKRVSVDFYFLGLEAGMFNGNIVTTPTSYTEYDPIILSALRNVIDQNIAKAPGFIRTKLSTSQTSSQVIVKAANAVYPWFRGGISVGIAF